MGELEKNESAAKSTKKTAPKKTAAKKATPKKVVEKPVVEKPIIPKEVDLSEYITVKNGFQGGLVYKSKRTGETFIWDEFGDEQEIELRELKNAKNSCKGFFRNNWFMFDEEFDWVIDYLGMRSFYKGALTIDEFENLFDRDADEIAEIIDEMSPGQKRSAAYRARQLVESGEIDSRKAIATLEKHLGIALIEE